MAQKAVQTVKAIMKKIPHHESDPHLALLDNRNIPGVDGIGSPAQRLMGRRTKTLIPTTDTLLAPKTIDPSVVQMKLTHHKMQQNSTMIRTQDFYQSYTLESQYLCR